jgi:putative ABC transport system substrate-binding protein
LQQGYPVIDRRAFLQATALAVLASPLIAEARGAASSRVPRIGVLGDVSPIPWMVKTSAVDIECRWADGRRGRLLELAAELVSLDVDVIVAAGVGAARAAKGMTRTIPIVFAAGGDPVEQGLVRSMAHPGGNVTGLSVPSEAEIARQQLRLLAQVVPRIGALAVLKNPDGPSGNHVLGYVRGMAGPAVDVRAFDARSLEEIEQAFVAIRAEEMGGLLVLPDALFAIHVRRIVDLAAQNRLPAVYGARSFTEAGGLMALSGDTAEVLRRTVAMVARILEGSLPATLPVESLTHLEITINTETARVLGLVLPRSLLTRADAIIRARP